MTHRSKTGRVLAALLFAGGAAAGLAGGPAAAQLAQPLQVMPPAATAAPPAPRTVVTAPLQDLTPSGGLGESAERLWSDMMDMFGFSGGSASIMRNYGNMQRGRAIQEDFAWLMDISGYKLKEIESSIGIIPTFGLTFGQARELTEADRDYVERMLDRHARRNPGPVAVMQRTIVRGILDATEIGGFTVDKVDVDLFPLPRVKFVLTPTDAPLGIEASRILRAIDRLNARVQTMSAARPQGMLPGMDLPQTPPGPSLRPASISH